MARFKVLLTDYAWPDLDIERSLLSDADAELVVAESQDVASLISSVADVDAIITCWAQVPKELIDAAANCRIVARLGIGVDNIDVSYCTSKGIPVPNVPDYCTDEVAEHTLALVLSLSRKTALYHHETKSGRYDRNAGPMLRRLKGQTLGILGLGKIGRRFAALAASLGLKVVATSRKQREPQPHIVHLELNDLLAQADFISLHLPLTAETAHIIGRNQLAMMKPTAYLINTARGGLVDHLALADALRRNQIAGAALDVQEPEPPDLSQPPFNDPRVLVTPHAAFLSVESLDELRRRTVDQVITRLHGGVPANIVNPRVCG